MNQRYLDALVEELTISLATEFSIGFCGLEENHCICKYEWVFEALFGNVSWRSSF